VAIPETAFWAGEGPGGGSTRLTSRSSVGRCSRPCHWPGYPLANGLSEMSLQSFACSKNCRARLTSRATVAVAYFFASHSR